MNFNLQDEQEFLVFAADNYVNYGCVEAEEWHEEFRQDLLKFQYIQRQFKIYENTGDINERIALNHLIILQNVFTENVVDMLLYKIELKYHAILKTFLIYLRYIEIEDNRFKNIPLDGKLMEVLQRK